MDELVYKKSNLLKKAPTISVKDTLPSISEIEESQKKELQELAVWRFEKDERLSQLNFIPLNITTNLSENEILRLLISVPVNERGDQILYALAKQSVSALIANRLLSMIEVMERLVRIQVDSERASPS